MRVLVDGELVEVEELDLCRVCGDHGVYGLCSACAWLRGYFALNKAWDRSVLDAWLQDKGLYSVAPSITGGDFFPDATVIHFGTTRLPMAPNTATRLTEYRP